jgi:hypothetical protein
MRPSNRRAPPAITRGAGRLVIAFFAVAALVAGCDGEGDGSPPEEDVFVPSGDPGLTVGFYEHYDIDAEFSVLGDGGEIPVVNGLQGGTWAMPTLRTEGLNSLCLVHCTLTTDAGELVGETDTKAKFFRLHDEVDFLEAPNFPIHIYHRDAEAAPIDDLFGLSATFECMVDDQLGAMTTESFGVTIVQGDL